MLLAVAVAVLLGMIAVLTKICTHRYAIGGWHALLTVPAPYVLVALAVALTVLQQSAFHAGALQASVPIMLVGEPIVAVLLGAVVLGEHLSVRGPAAPVLVVAVAAMAASTVALGRSETGVREVSRGLRGLGTARLRSTTGERTRGGRAEERSAAALSVQPPRMPC